MSEEKSMNTPHSMPQQQAQQPQQQQQAQQPQPQQQAQQPQQQQQAKQPQQQQQAQQPQQQQAQQPQQQQAQRNMSDGSTSGTANMENVKYAGFWMRFLAAFIDGLVLIPIMFVVIMAAGMVLGASISLTSPESLENSGFITIIGFVIQFLPGVLYYTLTTGSGMQATVGKKVLGLRVIRPDGSKITYLRALGRYFASILSYLILLLGYIMAAFSKEKKALHDIIAGTRVVYKDSLQ